MILLGATGMIGQGVLRECLLDPHVESVLAIGRSGIGRHHPKLREILLLDLNKITTVPDEIRGFDACFDCMGISSIGRSEAEYRRVTYDLTVEIGRTLSELNPKMTFIYVSGAGTDTSGRGRTMWARVKGQTENALLALPFGAAFMFRPGVVRSLHGIRSKQRVYRVLYAVLLPFIWLASVISPNSVTTTEKVGRAMIHVALRGAPMKWLGNRDINLAAA